MSKKRSMRTPVFLLAVAVQLGCGDQRETPIAVISPTGPGAAMGRAWVAGPGDVSTTLFDLGHVMQITRLDQSGDRVLSQDEGRWILWDRTTQTQVCEGRSAVQLKGSTLLVQSTRLELRSAADCQVLTSLQFEGTPGLSIDGLYAWASSGRGITAWNLSGEIVASASGDYSRARVFGSSGELRVAQSASHQDAIEVFDLSSGKMSVTPRFSGTFHSWFLDGEKFLTTVSNVVWIYSSSAAQLGIVSLPTTMNLTGQGDYFWTYQEDPGPLDIYRVGGGSSPEISYTRLFSRAIGIQNIIGFLPYGAAAFDIISLDPSGVTRTSHQVPMAYLTAFGSDQGEWTVGNSRGAIFESTSGLSLGYGQVFSIAGADTGTAAVAVASGQILTFNVQPSEATWIGSINFASSHVELSSDGTVLAGKGNTEDAQFWTDRSVRVFAVPTLIETATWPHDYSSYPTLFFEFGLSRSGDHLVHLEGRWDGLSWSRSRMLTDIPGEVTYFRDTGSPARPPPEMREIYKLSPDGRRFALNSSGAAQLFEDGQLVSAVPGDAVGWLDSDRLLVNVRTDPGPRFFVRMYDSRGTLLSNPRLPDGWIGTFNVISPTRILVQSVERGPIESRTIYDLDTGAVIWSRPTARLSAVAGQFIIYSEGAQVRAEQYPQPNSSLALPRLR